MKAQEAEIEAMVAKEVVVLRGQVRGGLLAIRHPIETDDLDPVLAVGLLHGSISSQCGRIVNGKDGRQVLVGLQGGGCRLIALGAISVSIQFRNNFNLPGSPAFIVGIDDLLEAVHTEDAGVGLLKIENEDLPALLA